MSCVLFARNLHDNKRSLHNTINGEANQIKGFSIQLIAKKSIKRL